MADPNNMANCPCIVQQFAPITFNTIAFQNGANTIYQAKAATVAASKAGTLGTAANGQPTFKSDFERMQYLLGRQNQVASCGVPKKVFANRY
ncbi:MAG: hypothetical protein EBY22_16290 [Gammaproteobacteria bacterium]|nr:hypothetical protein [Gammaproteobacteria bacterium]